MKFHNILVFLTFDFVRVVEVWVVNTFTVLRYE